jgi:hypothetical protein
MGKKGRKGNGEVMARREDVLKMHLQGKSKSFIASYIIDNYNVGLSTVEKDITYVHRQILDAYAAQAVDIIADHVARYDYLYSLLVDEGTDSNPNIHYNPADASRVLPLKEKLMGLHRMDTIIAPVINIDTTAITDAAIEKYLADKNKKQE